MTGEKYQEAAMRTAAGLTDEQLLLNGVMGLNGEAGECIDLVKKAYFQGHTLDKKKLKEEVGDVLWYAAILCEALGTDLDEVMWQNVEKLKKRYPDGFNAGRSIHREE